MKSSLLLLVPALSLIQSCSSDDEPQFSLPAVTSTGANTLGFEVDDRVWINYGQRCVGFGSCYDNEIEASVSTHNGVSSFIVTAGLTTDKYDEHFTLQIDTLRGPGTYRTGKARPNLSATAIAASPNGITLRERNNNKATSYVSRQPDAVRIILTRVDTVKRIVSGTFEGQLEDGLHPGTYSTIRYGRFDLTYTK